MNRMTSEQCRIYFNETLKTWVTQAGDGYYAKDVDYNRTARSAVEGAEKMGLEITNRKEMACYVTAEA